MTDNNARKRKESDTTIPPVITTTTDKSVKKSKNTVHVKMTREEYESRQAKILEAALYLVYEHEKNEVKVRKQKVWTFNVDWDRMSHGKSEFGSAKSIVASSFAEVFLKLCKLGEESFDKYLGEDAWEEADHAPVEIKEEDNIDYDDEGDFTQEFKEQHSILDCELDQLTLDRAKSIVKCLENNIVQCSDYCYAASKLVTVDL